MEGNLRFKIGQTYTWRKVCVSKSIRLAYSWKEIYVSNLQKGFIETRLEDNLSKTHPCKYFVSIEGNLRFKIGQTYTWRKVCVSKSIRLAYSWKEIYVSNLQKGFIETRLEDDLSKTHPCKYFVSIWTEEIQE